MDYEILSISTVSSTQKYVKERCHGWDRKKITFVSADEQTQGQGTKGTSWHSPQGQNLYVSAYFSSKKGEIPPQLIAQMTTLSITKVLESKEVFPKIKWPNDLLIEGKKCGGVLVELLEEPTLWHFIVGFGLNISMGEQDLSKIPQAATSLEMITQRSWNKQELLYEIVMTLMRDLGEMRTKGASSILPELKKRLCYLGETVVFDDGKTKHRGRFVGVSSRGGFLLQKTPKNLVAKEQDSLEEFFSGKVTQIDLQE